MRWSRPDAAPPALCSKGWWQLPAQLDVPRDTSRAGSAVGRQRRGQEPTARQAWPCRRQLAWEINPEHKAEKARRGMLPSHLARCLSMYSCSSDTCSSATTARASSWLLSCSKSSWRGKETRRKQGALRDGSDVAQSLSARRDRPLPHRSAPAPLGVRLQKEPKTDARGEGSLVTLAQCSAGTAAPGHRPGRPGSLPLPEHRHGGQGQPRTGSNACLPKPSLTAPEASQTTGGAVARIGTRTQRAFTPVVCCKGK